MDIEHMWKNKLIGKQMTWNKIVEAFPDRWVALKEYELDEYLEAIRGTLVIVCHDWEIGEELNKLTEEERNVPMWWGRTTIAEGVR